MDFLADLDLRPVLLKENRGYQARGLALGHGNQPLEVLIAESNHRPTQSDLKAVWKARLGGRTTPLLLVVLYGNGVAMCGPLGEQPPTFPDLESSRVERICRTALEEPDRHAALRFLHSAIPQVDAPMA